MADGNTDHEVRGEKGEIIRALPLNYHEGIVINRALQELAKMVDGGISDSMAKIIENIQNRVVSTFTGV